MAPTRARSASGRTSWTPPRCRLGRKPGSLSASEVAAWRRRASSTSGVGSNPTASSWPAEKLVCRASCSRTASNSSVLIANDCSGSGAARMQTRESTRIAHASYLRRRAGGEGPLQPWAADVDAVDRNLVAVLADEHSRATGAQHVVRLARHRHTVDHEAQVVASGGDRQLVAGRARFDG